MVGYKLSGWVNKRRRGSLRKGKEVYVEEGWRMVKKNSVYSRSDMREGESRLRELRGKQV